MDMSERVRSPRARARRETLDRIKSIQDKVQTMRRWWTAESTVYVPEAERPTGGSYIRPRLLHEYPEAQRRYWRGTMATIDATIQELQDLRVHCLMEFHGTPEDSKES